MTSVILILAGALALPAVFDGFAILEDWWLRTVEPALFPDLRGAQW